MARHTFSPVRASKPQRRLSATFGMGLSLVRKVCPALVGVSTPSRFFSRRASRSSSATVSAKGSATTSRTSLAVPAGNSARAKGTPGVKMRISSAKMSLGPGAISPSRSSSAPSPSTSPKNPPKNSVTALIMAGLRSGWGSMSMIWSRSGRDCKKSSKCWARPGPSACSSAAATSSKNISSATLPMRVDTETGSACVIRSSIRSGGMTGR